MRKFKIFHSKYVLLSTLLLIVIIASSLQAQDTEPKDEDDPASASSVVSETSGGPDAFGYTFTDQAEGCTYDFVDISTTGTPVVSGDDVGAPISLAEPINIYGTDFMTLAASSNGYISTDSTDNGPDLSNDCPLPVIPSSPGGTTGARLYPLHDDLIVGQLFSQYFATCPRQSQVGNGVESCTVVQWSNTTHFGGGGPFDFEVILYHTSFQIVFQIGPNNPELGSGSTTGIQDFSPPTTALNYACNTANSIPDNSAVCFFNPEGGIPGGSRPVAQTQKAAVVREPEPLCSDLDGSTSPIVRASLPPGVYATFCRIIAENGVYRRTAGEIGVQSVIDHGVIHAVDVFSPAGESGVGTGLCLQGVGGLLFLPSNQSPRTPQWLESYESNGYTCATLPGTGTVVLVNN